MRRTAFYLFFERVLTVEGVFYGSRGHVSLLTARTVRAAEEVVEINHVGYCLRGTVSSQVYPAIPLPVNKQYFVGKQQYSVGKQQYSISKQ